jgi:hypothetical protein
MPDMRQDLLDLFHTLEWTNTRIDKLRTDVTDYVGSSFQGITEKNSWTGQTILRVTNTKPLPPQIKLETGSVAHELRATLDRLACTLAIRHDKNGSTNGVYFPISKDSAIFASDGKRKIRKLSPDDRQRIEAINPYKGGNDLLFALHTVDLASKHIRLTSTASSIGTIGIGPGSLAGGTSIGGGGVVPDNGSVVIAILGAGSTTNITANIEVCFADPTEVAGRPVVPTLRDFARAVQDIVSLFN